MRHHAPQCSWHCDQYPHECDCGVSRPATIQWASREVTAAEAAVERAKEQVAAARERLDAME